MHPSHLSLSGGVKTLLLPALLALIPTQVAAADQAWLSPRLNDHPLAGVIVDASGRTVPETDLISALGTARFAFVGEKHDNPDHHRIESRLIQARLARQPGSAVVFEMLDDGQRPALAKLSADDDLDAIGSKLAWPQQGWDLAIYGPLFQAALRDGRLVAGNIGKAFIGNMYQQGEPMLAVLPRFRSAALSSASARSYLLDRIFEAHCGKQARESLQPMLAIQLAKDASMADAMLSSVPAILIAGGEHVRGDTGVPSHIDALQPDATRVVIQLIEVTAGQDDPREAIKQAGPADYYWFTPATEPKDYCAEVSGRAAR